MPIPSFKTTLYAISKSFEQGCLHPILRRLHSLFAGIFLRGRIIHVATGSNSSHFHSMLQLINSLKNVERRNFRVVAYDLGLTDSERLVFHRVHPDLSLRRFPFENYPDHFDMSKGAGEYAWKPCILQEVYSELRNGDLLVWLDAGNFITRKMWVVRSALFFRGFYTRITTGTIGEWTHEDTIGRLNMSRARHYRMICGCLIGVRKDARNNRLVREWRDSAIDRGVIAPEGSSRSNHRQDQSVVSLLYYKYYPHRKRPPLLSRLEHELAIHQDIG